MGFVVLALVIVLSVGGMIVCYQIGKLTAKVAALEDAKQKRLPHQVAAGLEDATAVGMDLQRQIMDARIGLDALHQRAERELFILRTLRSGEYDMESPAGPRAKRRQSVEAEL